MEEGYHEGNIPEDKRNFRRKLDVTVDRNVLTGYGLPPANLKTKGEKNKPSSRNPILEPGDDTKVVTERRPLARNPLLDQSGPPVEPPPRARDPILSPR
jgi:hypothetical protein